MPSRVDPYRVLEVRFQSRCLIALPPCEFIDLHVSRYLASLILTYLSSVHPVCRDTCCLKELCLFLLFDFNLWLFLGLFWSRNLLSYN
jgi:hypothetical protein